MAELKNYTTAMPISAENGKHSQRNGKTNGVEPMEMATINVQEQKEIGNNTDDGGGKNGKEKKEKKEKLPMVGVAEVFRFSDWKDKLMMVIATFAAAINGAALPCMIIVFGDMIDLFADTGRLEVYLNQIGAFLNYTGLKKEDIFKDTSKLPPLCANISIFYHGNNTCPPVDLGDGILDEMSTYAIYYCIIGVGVLITAYFQVSLWMIAAERQAHRIRQEFLKNVMRQDIGWFDTHEAAELSTRLADDVSKIQDGIGDKMGSFVQWLSSFIAGFVIGFIYGWKLTLVILAVSPFLVGAAALFSRLAASMTSKELEAYARAGAVAEEVFGALRTVVAFGGQEKEALRYSNNLGAAQKFGIRKGFTNGASMGFIWLVIFSCYALGFWFGGKLVREDEYTVGNMIIVFFSVLIGAFSLGNAAPNIQSLATARGAAYIVFQLIDLKSAIDSSSEEGIRPSSVTGTIQFKDIHFCYPSRPDVKVLNGMTLEAKPGQTVALVGSSGCGKSTSVSLLMRFYDPIQGQVLLDGVNVKELNIKWLRKHIGLVSQEPVLFATTIAENIKYGREGVTMDEIVEATKNANAYDFIMKLPDKLDTMVGERGAQLSGGQKQRIAIARALVRDPKILLLDEATSALDTESEAIVQDALDKARKGRTTLVIAHRLSTIKTADIIVGFDKGVIVEKGTHDELMVKQGIYYQLVTSQSQVKTDEEDQIEEFTDVSPEKKLLQRGMSREMQRKISVVNGKVEEEEEEKLPNAPFTRLMRLNAPEWYFIILGCFGAIVNGGVQPAFAVIFSKVLSVFSETKDEQERLIQLYSLIFFGLGLVSLITMFLQGYMFGRSGEALTTRLRDLTFRSMLRQDVSWFDDPKNSVGALTTRLATDASLVQGASGVRLGSLVQSAGNLITGLTISFTVSWKLTFVMLSIAPFIAAAGLSNMKLIAGMSSQNKGTLEEAGKIAVEVIGNARTVSALGIEEYFQQSFTNTLKVSHKFILRTSHASAILFAIAQASLYCIYAVGFYYSAILIEDMENNFDEVMRVFTCLVFSFIAIGQASGLAPDLGKATGAARRVFALLDRVPSSNAALDIGYKPAEGTFKSDIHFQDVHFTYCSRPDVRILNGLSMSIQQGQTVALIGKSGCGKSTVINLVEKFYSLNSGTMLLDNWNSEDLNTPWLRAQLGLVSQEPVLFNCSIYENIAYGDNSRVVGRDEIIKAAKCANIHNFIEALPEGYETNVGERGTQMSGGQKQRIAIARALVRNPKILLLDEATSALDTESEIVVQEALDKARVGRTCIVIAHRLSTIVNSDKIFVIDKGEVVEQGTHNELLASKGIYYKLQTIQNRRRC